MVGGPSLVSSSPQRGASSDRRIVNGLPRPIDPSWAFGASLNSTLEGGGSRPVRAPPPLNGAPMDLPPITTIASLQEHLQAAIALEFSTIPVYLAGQWTIMDQNNT